MCIAREVWPFERSFCGQDMTNWWNWYKFSRGLQDSWVTGLILRRNAKQQTQCILTAKDLTGKRTSSIVPWQRCKEKTRPRVVQSSAHLRTLGRFDIFFHKPQPTRASRALSKKSDNCDISQVSAQLHRRRYWNTSTVACGKTWNGPRQLDFWGANCSMCAKTIARLLLCSSFSWHVHHSNKGIVVYFFVVRIFVELLKYSIFISLTEDKHWKCQESVQTAMYPRNTE